MRTEKATSKEFLLWLYLNLSLNLFRCICSCVSVHKFLRAIACLFIALSRTELHVIDSCALLRAGSFVRGFTRLLAESCRRVHCLRAVACSSRECSCIPMRVVSCAQFYARSWTPSFAHKSHALVEQTRKRENRQEFSSYFPFKHFSYYSQMKQIFFFTYLSNLLH